MRQCLLAFRSKYFQKKIVCASLSTSACPQAEDMAVWMEAINRVLQRFSDKDWNYSRIALTLESLKERMTPYVLGVDWLDVRGKQGMAEFQTSQSEISWGMRHSHELGILEIISLRLNHALSELTTAEEWQGIRPVIRLQKRSELMDKGQTHAFWYRVEEVQGETFENR